MTLQPKNVVLPGTMSEAQSAEGAPFTPSKMHEQHKWWTPVLHDTYYSQAGRGNPKPKHFTWLTASLSLFSSYQKTLRCLKMHSTSWQGKESPTINPPSYTCIQGYGSDLQPSSYQLNTLQNRPLPLRAAVVKAVDVYPKEHHHHL